MRKGIDVSDNNHPGDAPINWDKLAAFYARIEPGYQPIAAIKVLEGRGYFNPFAALDGLRARSAGFGLIWYDFARPSQGDGRGEAERFVAALRATGLWQPVDRVAIDHEDERIAPTADLAAWQLDWYQFVDKELATRPFLYSNQSYLVDHNLSIPQITTTHDLWLAAWQDALPTTPAGWDSVVIWQHSDHGRVPGISGEVDLDWGIGL